MSAELISSNNLPNEIALPAGLGILSSVSVSLVRADISAALACRIGRELAENITTRMKMERVEYQVSNLIALLDRAGTSPSEKSEIICNFIKREYDLDV